MESEQFDRLIRRIHGATTRRALVGGGLGATAKALAQLRFGLEESAARKKKKKPVCLCPTTDATGCTNKKAKKKQAKKLASQACNYAGTCRTGVIGPQCPPSTTTTPAPGCPSGQTLCGAACFDLQRDDDNCGACGIRCASVEHCSAGACVPRTCGEGGPCLVFVTSTTYTGKLGGLAGADAACNERAAEAGRPGSYKAWLSDSTGSPSTRFVRNPGPYRRVDGALVAATWDGLTDGTLGAPINVTEWGGLFEASAVWTSTGPNGTEAPYGSCLNWSNDGMTPFLGGVGITISTGTDWTEGGAAVCSQRHPLYCFQQS